MKLVLVTLCLLASAWALTTAQQHMLVVLRPTTSTQVEILRNATENDYDLDFWTHPNLEGNTLIRMPVTRFGQLRQEWAKVGLQATVRHENLEQRVKQMQEEDEHYRQINPWSATTYKTSLTHNVYRDYNSVINVVRSLENQYPSLLRFDDTASTPFRPKTLENRPIHYFEVGAISNAPVIFMEVNIHAREWVTAAANLYTIDWLLSNYGSNNDATWLLNNFRIVNIPIANPDGYDFSHLNQNNRYWRKNRRSCGAGSFGVDLNRNFDYQWGGTGSSSTCTSDSYRGASAASEPETQAIRTLFQYFESSAAMYLSVHAFSQVILLPWTYSTQSNAYNTWHQTAGNSMAAAMTSVEGRYHYAATAISAIGYTASGSTLDWALARRAGSNQNFLALAYELRPASSNNIADFNIPASNIVPAGKELLASLVVVARAYADRISG